MALREKMSEYYSTSSDYSNNLSKHDHEYYAHYITCVSRYAKHGSRILDVGCGTGLSSKLLSDKGYYVIGSDISPLFLANVKESENLKYKIADATMLPFADGEFDVVSGYEFLEHVPLIEKVIDEATRVISPGGFVIFMGPNVLSPIHCIKQFIRLALGKSQPHLLFGVSCLDALKKTFLHTAAIRRRVASNTPIFEYREPDLSKVGGDHDCIFLANPVDIARYMRQRGYEIVSYNPSRRGGILGHIASICFPNYRGGTNIVAKRIV